MTTPALAPPHPPHTHTDSPLHRDFPSTASLSRADLLALVNGEPSSGGPSEGPKVNAAAEDAYFEAFLHSLPEVRALYEEHRGLLGDNEGKAAHNLTLQPTLESLRQETQYHHDAALALEREWPAVQAGMRGAYQRFTPAALTARLTHSASRLHETSESLALSFIEDLDLPSPPHSSSSPAPASASASAPADGTDTPKEGRDAREQDPTTAFVKRYREMRSEYHLINLLAERAGGKGREGVQWE